MPMTNKRIKKAAVLGAGVMGSKIAALLSGADIPVYLLDITPGELTEQDAKKGLTENSPGFRNKLARTGVDNALKASPPAFYVPADATLITPGNLDDNLAWMSEVDWIIEAVLEDLDTKKEVLRKIGSHARANTIVSTNTSGVSVQRMSEGLPRGAREYFLGTHFFNPPRHMRLLEIIAGKSTDKGVLSFMADFCEKRLGKSIVFAKDTPNFIANRIGAHAMLTVIRTMIEDGYTIEEVDAITGPPMGRPKAASFRTADMVGLDTLVRVAENVCENVEDAAEKEAFSVPPFIRQMVETGLLGDKTQMGFYKKVLGGQGSLICAMDYNTMEYVPQRRPHLPLLDELKGIAYLPTRLQTLAYSDSRAGLFAWKVIKKMLAYCASRIPEISDDILNIDRAMKWGYNWESGPFETWDAIGLKRSVDRMEKEGDAIPRNVERMLLLGKNRFYVKQDARQYYFDFRKTDYAQIEEKPATIILPSLKERRRLIKSNPGASLVDLGDGVACLELHSPNEAVDLDVIQMIEGSVTEVEENFEALVIGNQGTNFCVGADLKQIFPLTQNGDWETLEAVVEQFQQSMMRLKYSDKPVVAAPFRMSLGGGCEICLAASMVRPHAEAYMGLVEVGVGLIPGGGGNKEMLLRATDWMPTVLPSAVPGGGRPDLTPYVSRIFETIATAKVSSSARDARELGYLRSGDRVTMNLSHLLYDAKRSALSLARDGYHAPRPRDNIRAIGRTGRAYLELFVYLMKDGGFITDFDAHIAKKLAFVLSGGDVDQNTLVTEQYLLDLEREAFLSLCGEERSQSRMKHMIETNKPLRN